mgnify:CR=1 FL=1
MALKQIKTPRGCIIQGDKGKAELRWDSSFTPRANQNFNRMQKFVDSEVLRRCSPRVPFQTGTLEKSGKLGTTVGSGRQWTGRIHCSVRQNAVLRYRTEQTVRCEQRS